MEAQLWRYVRPLVCRPPLAILTTNDHGKHVLSCRQEGIIIRTEPNLNPKQTVWDISSLTHLTASRLGQDNRGRRRSAAISHSQLSWQDVARRGKMWQLFMYMYIYIYIYIYIYVCTSLSLSLYIYIYMVSVAKCALLHKTWHTCMGICGTSVKQRFPDPVSKQLSLNIISITNIIHSLSILSILNIYSF